MVMGEVAPLELRHLGHRQIQVSDMEMGDPHPQGNHR